MPLDAAADGISLAEQHVANMLADSAAFQAFANAADATAARSRIYFDALPPPEADNGVYSKDELVAYRPFAIVFTAPANGYKRTRGATGCYVESGQIGLHLEQNVPEALANDLQQPMRQIKSTLGAIINDLEALAYGAGYLAVNVIDVLVVAREAEDAITQEGDNVFAMLNLVWGAD
jgi:hypothetical protein